MENKYVACNMTLEEIGTLAAALEKNNLERIKIKNGDCEVVIEAKRKCTAVPMMPPMSAPMQPTVNVTAAAATEISSKPETEKAFDGNVVKSPIVGTYYSSPSPDKPPFVKVGDKVKKGDVIMIIESMKLMNEVQSEFDGVVSEILIENAQAVEFDQPIMIIK